VRPKVKEGFAKKWSSMFSGGGSGWSRSGEKSSGWAKIRPGSNSSWFRFRQSSSNNKSSEEQGPSETEEQTENPSSHPVSSGETEDLDPSALLPLRETTPEKAKEDNNTANDAKERLADVPESRELNVEEDAWFKDSNYYQTMNTMKAMAKSQS
jgi:hypothetical protein